MGTLKFSLRITKDQYLAYYTGAVKDIITRGHDGRTIRFPAKILQPFVTHDGVAGTFELKTDENNRFKEIRRVV